VNKPLRILSVCTHNRTRSVIAAALLAEHLNTAGIAADVRSAGTLATGDPAMDQAVRLLQAAGHDVSEHRSQQVTRELVSGADLVCTAEAAHVVWIAGHWPDMFTRTFTLPEVVKLGDSVGALEDQQMAEWTARLAAGRPPARDYMEPGLIPEMADPTGGPNQVWEAAFARIDSLTSRLAALLRRT
jgi:protein-tyrosine-phosphatase